jgi:hypothetical protein
MTVLYASIAAFSAARLHSSRAAQSCAAAQFLRHLPSLA